MKKAKELTDGSLPEQLPSWKPVGQISWDEKLVRLREHHEKFMSDETYRSQFIEGYQASLAKKSS